ncbi:hypothetical protein Y695_02857 [Hydrogenophaga sp. T4]|nr:hypothetical protein Y695_02857 [Hydrogenophaga sp. T4]
MQSRHVHAVLDVLPGFGLVERVEVKARDHALCELLQFGPGQQVAQLRLTDQDDLQQLAGVGLQVGQQAQLFEHVGRQVLRFVDDEHGVLSCGVGGQQKSVERVDVVFGGGLTRTLVVHHHPELVTDRAQQLDDRELGVEDVSDPAVLGGLLQKAAADGGLAGADLAGEQHKTATALNAVQQMGERLPVAFAHEEVTRVGRDGEGALLQAKEVGVHARSIAGARSWDNRARHALAGRGSDAFDQAARAMAGMLVELDLLLLLAEAFTEHSMSPES